MSVTIIPNPRPAWLVSPQLNSTDSIVLDLYQEPIVGWKVEYHSTTRNDSEAFPVTLSDDKSGPNAIYYSDTEEWCVHGSLAGKGLDALKKNFQERIDRIRKK